MSKPALALDNSVLSSLFASGWFDAPSFYWPDHTILVPARAWNGEFTPYHDLKRERDWITVREVDPESVQTRALGHTVGDNYVKIFDTPGVEILHATIADSIS